MFLLSQLYYKINPILILFLFSNGIIFIHNHIFFSKVTAIFFKIRRHLVQVYRVVSDFFIWLKNQSILRIQDVLIFLHLIIYFTIHFWVRGKHLNNSFTSMGFWFIWGRRTHFRKLLVSHKLCHNNTVTSQSSIWNSREHGVFSANILISLLVSTCWFGRRNMCL